MNVHMHKWEMSYVKFINCDVATCKCLAMLDHKEMERRINAIEVLLKHSCRCYDDGRERHSISCPGYHLEWAYGKSIADILDGKDD